MCLTSFEEPILELLVLPIGLPVASSGWFRLAIAPVGV